MLLVRGLRLKIAKQKEEEEATNSFLLLVIMHLLLVVMHLFLDNKKKREEPQEDSSVCESNVNLQEDHITPRLVKRRDLPRFIHVSSILIFTESFFDFESSFHPKDRVDDRPQTAPVTGSKHRRAVRPNVRHSFTTLPAWEQMIVELPRTQSK